MANLPMKPPPGVPARFADLSSREAKQRTMELTRVIRAILKRFWRDSNETDFEQSFEVSTWLKVLQSCTEEEVKWAWVDYQTKGPRSQAGALYRPDPGAIKKLVIQRRGRDREQREGGAQ